MSKKKISELEKFVEWINETCYMSASHIHHHKTGKWKTVELINQFQIEKTQNIQPIEPLAGKGYLVTSNGKTSDYQTKSRAMSAVKHLLSTHHQVTITKLVPHNSAKWKTI